MVLLIIFLVSLVLSALLVRRVYRKQLGLKPDGKLKARFIAGFVGVAFFFVVNALAISFQVADTGKDRVSARVVFDEVTVDKFNRLYNDDLGGIEASNHSDLSLIKISSYEQQDNEVGFKVGHGVSGRAEVDNNGQITNIYWTIKNADSLSLLSMASVIEVLDPTMDRTSATEFLKHSIGSPNQINLSSETKKVSYNLTKPVDGNLTLHLVPKM